MAKHKAQVKLHSFGIYREWNKDDKNLPQIQTFTLDIPAQLEIEFGLIINIKKARGEKLRYCIYHPDIPDDDGQPMAPFDGEEYIRSNDWNFYLGDTLWPPLENKLGDWRMTIEIGGNVVADKTFCVAQEYASDEYAFFKRRR